MLYLTIEFLNHDVKGPFVASIDTQSFKLYGIPRDCVQDAINKLDKNLQGIYFLVNTNERGGNRYLYIGQTKQGPERLIDHRVKKPEWNMAYMFLATKNYLSLQIVDELESLEIQRFTACGKFNLFNSRPNLAEASSLAKLFSEGMEETLSFFGYDVAPEESEKSSFDTDTGIYRIKSLGAEAFLKLGSEGEFILLADSHVVKEMKEYANRGTKELQAKCIKDKTLIEDGAFYKLTKDISFSSPSSAGEFMTGRAVDGWVEFKDNQGNTLDSKIRKVIKK
jgi:hypothetical protein